MKNILKKRNSKWFLLFLFTFLSLGMQAQIDEGGTNNDGMEDIIDDYTADDYAPLDWSVIDGYEGTLLDEVEIIGNSPDDDPFMDLLDIYDPYEAPDTDPFEDPGNDTPPKDFTDSNPPNKCTLGACSKGYEVDQSKCECVPIPVPWYLDNDGDGWHDKDSLPINAIESPPGNYKDKTSGADCDDDKDWVTNNCYKIYYQDDDNDGYHSAEVLSDKQYDYKTSTLGLDCDDDPDTGANVHKLNKCGKCEAEPVSGSCVSIDCDGKISKIKLLETAKKLNITAEHILAVFIVESEGNAFRGNGDPKILFERHYFSALTNGKYDVSDPDISNPVQGGYGLYSEQLEKLNRAYALDPEAAIRSASFGAFQIMGKNYSMCGYTDVAKFHNDMTSKNLDFHLKAFENYVITNNLQDELRNDQWADFARQYNGKKYKKNKYDTNMAKAYQKLIDNINLMLKDCF